MEQGLYKQSNLRHSKHLLKGTGLKRHAKKKKICLSIKASCWLVVKFKLKCTAEICWWGKAEIKKTIRKHPWPFAQELSEGARKQLSTSWNQGVQLCMFLDNFSTGLEQLFLFSGISLPRRNPKLESYGITCHKSPLSSFYPLVQVPVLHQNL